MIDLAQAKRHLNLAVSDTSQDQEIQDMIDAATEWVESRVGPVVRRTISGEIQWPVSGEIFLDYRPVISVSSITSVYGYTATYTVTDYTIHGPTGRLVRNYGTATFAYPVSVTYVAGRASIPAAIRTAALLVLKSLWETQRGAVALSIQGLEDTDEVPGMGLAVWRAEKLLEPYLLPPAVA